MDRDGDGKVTEQEFNAYLEFLADLQIRARKACVSLVLTDESRGLFDLLDINRDGRLSIREMRGAAGLLARLDRDGKGFITAADLPAQLSSHSASSGPGKSAGDDYGSIVARIYGGGNNEQAYREPTQRPALVSQDGPEPRRRCLPPRMARQRGILPPNRRRRRRPHRTRKQKDSTPRTVSKRPEVQFMHPYVTIGWPMRAGMLATIASGRGALAITDRPLWPA